MPVLPESEVRVELKFIGDRSGILETIILLPEENCGLKMTKMGQELIKIAQKSRCFCTFSVFVLLKLARKRSTGQKTVHMTRQSVKRVIHKITSWKSRGARAPVPHSWRRQCRVDI